MSPIEIVESDDHGQRAARRFPDLSYGLGSRL